MIRIGPRKECGISNLCIYVDADGCPVKREVYRVAERLEVRVVLVANQWLRAPERDWIETIVVEDRFDAADDWIAERAGEGDVVVTADVPLASRCVANGARVLDPRGREFEEGSIGDAVAQRDLMAQLREAGVVTGGPAPFEKRDRSRFLQSLDRILQKIRRDAER